MKTETVRNARDLAGVVDTRGFNKRKLTPFSSLVLSIIKPISLGNLTEWLGNTICVSVDFPISSVSDLLLPFVLLSNVFHGEHCTALLLTARETWKIEPLPTPSTQRVYVHPSVIWTVKYSNLMGRRVVISSCNSSYFYVKSEFQSTIKKIKSENLFEILQLNTISKERTVILGTMNCTIFSAIGPLLNGIPAWVDGAEMLGVTTVLNSFGFKWSVYAVDGYGKIFSDGRAEEGKFIWIIKEGLVDIGFCDYGYNHGIIGDIVNPWQRSCTRLLVPGPQNPTWHWHTVFRPLPVQFWVAFLIFYFGSVATVFVIEWFFSGRKQKMAVKKFRNSFFKVLSFITLGMKHFSSIDKRTRMIEVSWALFMLIACAAYSSSLASLLTKPIEEEIPQTLVELLKRGYVWVSGYELLENAENYFKTESGVDEEWVKHQVQDSEIIRGKTAVLGEELNGVYIMDKTPKFKKSFLNSLVVSKECLAANHISIVTRKMSPYYEFIMAGFSRLAESGVLMKLLGDAFKSSRINKYIVKDAYKVTEYPLGKPLSMLPLRGALYVLLVGYLLSFVTFMAEVFYSMRRPPTSQTTKPKYPYAN